MTQMTRNWDRDIVEQFIKPESQQKSPGVFRETHVEIDKIRAEILRPHRGDDAFVSESEFRDAVLKSNLKDDNRIFIIKGEVGSGKSHLCQWLEYEINGYGGDGGIESEHIAIHISRSNTRLGEILDILHEPINKEYDEIKDISNLNPEEVADFIIQGLITFYGGTDGPIPDFDLRSFVKERPEKDELRSKLIENLIEYQESVREENREQNIEEHLLSRRDFGEICLSAFGETKRQDDVYPIIRRAVHDLLTNNLEIGDFQRELEEISKAYVEEGKRPVLICEDLTTFSVLKDDLIDHIFDLSSGHLDVVMGWTTGWERENIDDALSTSEDSLTYMKQRVQGYLTLTDERGEAFFLEGTSAPVLLVNSYLEAIKRHSDSTDEILEEAFDSLYPFNEAFIRHIYPNLIQDGNRQQTPRILLVHVIAECLTSDVPPFESIQNNAYIQSRPFLVDMNKYSGSCQELIQWYGMKHGSHLWLPVDVFDTFGVEIGPAGIEGNNAFFETNLAIGDIPIIERDPGTGEIKWNGTKGKSEDDQEVEPEDDTEADSQDIEQRDSSSNQVVVPPEDYREFQDWLINGTEYPSADRFKEGVIATLNRWYEPTRLANENSTVRHAYGIYFARGSEPPVVVKGADSPAAMSYELDHGIQNEELYHDMLIRGYSDSFQETSNFDRLQGWATNEVVKYRSQMREDIESTLPAGMAIEDLIVLSQYVIMNIGRGETELSTDLMFKSYRLEDTSPLHWNSNLSIDFSPGLREAFDQVAKHSKDIKNLSDGFFLLKKNFVDYERLEEAVSSVSENYDRYLNELSTTSVDDLADGYRIGSTRSNAQKRLKKIIEDISDLAGELEKLEQQISTDDLQKSVETYQLFHHLSHTQDGLAESYSKLDSSLGPLDVTHRREWQDVGELLNDPDHDIGLGDFRSTLNKIEETDTDDSISIIGFLHEFQRSLDECDIWKVYQALSEMVEELDNAEVEEMDDMRQQVEVSVEFENFRDQRDSLRNKIKEVNL